MIHYTDEGINMNEEDTGIGKRIDNTQNQRIECYKLDGYGPAIWVTYGNEKTYNKNCSDFDKELRCCSLGDQKACREETCPKVEQ